MSTPSSSRPPWEKKIETPAAGGLGRPPWEKENDAPPAGESSGIHTLDASKNFEFLNDSVTRANEAPASFHQFQELPLELREYIWEFSIPRRFLKITVVGAPLDNDYDYTRRYSSGEQLDPEGQDPYRAQYIRENELGNIVSDANYHLRLPLGSTRITSPLLYVNREANKVANRIYRVHLPTLHGRYRARSTQEGSPPLGSDSRCLQICPERDTIFISLERHQDEPYFAHFIHDALAHDPNKKGIVHMAIEREHTVQRVYLPIWHINLHARAQAALSSTLRGLESVSLVQLFRAPSRQMIFSLEHHFLSNNIPRSDKVRFNRAYPLWASTASYSALPVDPRPVSRYLDLVDCGWDPRSLIRAWRTFEEAYGVSPISSEKIRVLLAAIDPEDDPGIATTNQARWFREREEKAASRIWNKSGYFGLHFPELENPDTAEDLDFSKKHNAIGFWSVPLEAFGPVPEVPYDTHTWEMSRVCDLSAYESQIRLGLFHTT